MLLDFMDFYPRVISDGHGWHCNFHFGNGHDIIEDVENENSCMQALRYLIAKADAEIHDLEDELAILQCQLKWTKSDEQRDPYEVCCATFKQKIDVLSKSIKNVRDRNMHSEHVNTGKDTTNIQAPTERIYDIISTLIKQNFSAPDEQGEDMSNELNMHINSGSVDTEMEKETTLESCAESEELSIEFEKLYKPAATVSEESCSDIARYVTRDSIEARDINRTNTKETGQKKNDYECTPAGKNGFITCVQAYNDIVNSKSKALHHGEIKECVTGSKVSGSSSSPVSSKTEVTVKVEKYDDIDMRIELAADFLCNTQDLSENQSQSVGKIFNTYERNKSSLSSILKPPGQKVQRKIFSTTTQSNSSLMLSPHGNIGKREITSRPANCKQSNPSLMLRPQRNFPKLVFGLESPLAAEGIASLPDSSPEHVYTVESKGTIAEDVETKEESPNDLESLRLKLSQDSEFLKKMIVPKLKDILRFHKVRKISKLKKDGMVEEVTKLLSNS